jgi:hypothetical protein
MSNWDDPRRRQPQYSQRDYPPPQPVIEARGTGRTATWDGRTLVIRARAGGQVTAIPARQVSTVVFRPLNLEFTVITTDGRRHVVRYWPGQGGEFRALRDAVLGAAGASWHAG